MTDPDRSDAETSRIVDIVSGRAIVVRGDDIDTDRIIPARFLRSVTFDGLGEHAFEDDRKDHPGGPHPFDRPEFQGASILVVNSNFGCGSSREHAPQSLIRWGIRGVVGVSFAEIFFGNCVALGIPCLTLPASDVENLQEAAEKEPALEVTLDVGAGQIIHAGTTLSAGLPRGAREAFLSGTWDSMGLLMAKPEEVEAVAAKLPYVSEWGSQAG